MSDLAEFLDDRCARFARDPHYRMRLVRERFQDEALLAEERRLLIGYKPRKRAA